MEYTFEGQQPKPVSITQFIKTDTFYWSSCTKSCWGLARCKKNKTQQLNKLDCLKSWDSTVCFFVLVRTTKESKKRAFRGRKKRCNHDLAHLS